MRLHLPLPDNTTEPSPQTPSTLTFVVFLLSLHPEVLQRLRGEVLEVVGPTKRPGYEHVREMKYLRAVLNGQPPSPPNDECGFNLH